MKLHHFSPMTNNVMYFFHRVTAFGHFSTPNQNSIVHSHTLPFTLYPSLVFCLSLFAWWLLIVLNVFWFLASTLTIMSHLSSLPDWFCSVCDDNWLHQGLSQLIMIKIVEAQWKYSINTLFSNLSLLKNNTSKRHNLCVQLVHHMTINTA